MNETEKSKEVVRTSPQDIFSSMDGERIPTTAEMVDQATLRATYIEKAMPLALKNLTANDVVNMNGNPYLPATACQKIARIFGVSWKLQQPVALPVEDENGKYFIYSVTGNFRLGGDSIDAIGTCSMHDKFFARSGGKLRAMSEIDPGNIIKAAVSNCEQNGISKLLGIKGLTWEDIEKYAGFKRNNVASVQYGKGTKGGTTKPAEGQPDRIASDKQKGLITVKAIDKGLSEQDLNDLCKKISGKPLSMLPFEKVNEMLDTIYKMEEPAKKENDSQTDM